MIRYVCAGGVLSRFFIAGICLLTVFGPLSAQTETYYTAEESMGLRVGRTRPLYQSGAALPTDPAKLREVKKSKPTWVPNFAGRRHEPPRNPHALPADGDPLFSPLTARMETVDIFPSVNVEGMSQAVSGSGVPDVNGDVGRDFFVQMVNATYFRVYDKMGTPVSLPISANTIWNQVGLTSFGDPIILYDQEVDRWILTEFASVGARTVLVAISDSSDPLGAWTAYKFQTPRFPDFPKYGIWHDAYYFTANESGGAFPIYAINRADMIAGDSIVRFQRLTVPKVGGVGFEVGQPVDWDGLTAPPAGSPGLLVKLNDDAWGTTPEDVILLHRITIDWDTATNSNVSVEPIPTTPFDTDGCQLESTGGFSCIPQPNNQGIDGAEWIIANKAMYRHFPTHEAFVMSFLVDVNGEDVGGIRWMEFRKTADTDWHIYQEGTVGSEDGLHRFMSAIGIDGQGNIGLGYGVSGYDKFPSLRYTGRYATDEPGTMSFTEFEIATGSGSWGFDRYGDYFSMSVDPADDATFWFTGQYIPQNGSWSTRIAAFAAFRDSFDLLPVRLLSPVSSAELADTESIAIEVLNRGIRHVQDFQISYQFNGGDWISEPALADSLAVDSVYRHTFAATVGFDAPGAYPLRITSDLANDDNRLNDTLSFLVVKFAYEDLALQYVAQAQPGLICDDKTEVTVLLRNAGVTTATTARLELRLEGTPIDTIDWSGSLAFGDEELFSFPVAGLSEGDNNLEMTLISLNDAADQIPGNNEIAWSLTARPNGEPVFLSFRTDNFPQESRWELEDESQTLIASGGPYAESQTTYQENFCLDIGACYTFTVFDSFGDGMSAQGVTGDFEIMNSLGDVIADLDRPNFGLQSSSQFCLTDTCLLQVAAGIGHESGPAAGDGFLMGMPVNGLGHVVFSIDGGATFQTEPIFDQLTPGTYVLIARDGAGCLDSVTVEILQCDLTALMTSTPAIGGDVGSITVQVSGGIGPVTISLQGGAATTDTVFSMLEPGDYLITVSDSLGCSVSETVTVSGSVSTTSSTSGWWVSISPNPGRGLFDVSARLQDDRAFIPVTIWSAGGEPVGTGSLARYNDVHRGQLLMGHLTPGIYFMAFQSGRDWVIRRIILID